MSEGDKKFVDMHGIKKGNFMIVDGVACKVTDIQMSRPGKHGHAKARVTAVGITDGKKKIFVKPADARVEIPIIDKRQAQILSIRTETKTFEGKETVTHIANVMDMDSYETFDIEIPEEFVDKIAEGVQILYWDVMGNKMMQRLV